MGKYVAVASDHLVVPARVLQTAGQEERSGVWVGPCRPLFRSVSSLTQDRDEARWFLRSLRLCILRSAVPRIETSLAGVATTLFWVRLEFPGTRLAPINELAVARLPLPPLLHSFQGIIGRDLLRRWEYFLFQGRRGRLTIQDTRRRLFGWLTG